MSCETIITLEGELKDSLSTLNFSDLLSRFSFSQAGKIQLVLGPTEFSATVKDNKLSSVYVGFRAGGGASYANTVESSIKIGATEGLTVKLSGAYGYGIGGTGTAALYISSIDRFGFQLGAGMQTRTGAKFREIGEKPISGVWGRSVNVGVGYTWNLR